MQKLLFYRVNNKFIDARQMTNDDRVRHALLEANAISVYLETESDERQEDTLARVEEIYQSWLATKISENRKKR